ncbi:MAG: hypothetical protein ACRCT5_01480 [Tannerellaceae bacterium]
MKDSDEKVDYDQPQEFEEAGTSKKIEAELSDENKVIYGDETPGEPVGCPVKRKRNFWVILLLFVFGLILLVWGGRSCSGEEQNQPTEGTTTVIVE